MMNGKISRIILEIIQLGAMVQACFGSTDAICSISVGGDSQLHQHSLLVCATHRCLETYRQEMFKETFLICCTVACIVACRVAQFICGSSVAPALAPTVAPSMLLWGCCHRSQRSCDSEAERFPASSTETVIQAASCREP